MEQYINKSTLVAEIKKRRNKHFNSGGSPSSEYCHEDDEILGIIDTLKVKEVDLDEEFNKCCENYIFDDECEVYTAKRFFELGFRVAQKRE